MEMICAAIKMPLKASKRVDPAPCVPWVGIDIDFAAREARIPPAYLAKVRADIQSQWWLAVRVHPRVELESLVGRLARCAECVRNGHLRLFYLRRCLRLSYGRASVNISAPAKHELRWFLALASSWNGARATVIPCRRTPPPLRAWLVRRQ